MHTNIRVKLIASFPIVERKRSSVAQLKQFSVWLSKFIVTEKNNSFLLLFNNTFFHFFMRLKSIG